MKFVDNNIDSVDKTIESYKEIRDEVVSVLGILFNQVFKKYPDFDYSKYDRTKFMGLFYYDVEGKTPIATVLDLFNSFSFNFEITCRQYEELCISFSTVQKINELTSIPAQETYRLNYYDIQYSAFTNTERYVCDLISFIENNTDTMESLRVENEKLKREVAELKKSVKTSLDEYQKHTWKDVSPLTNPNFPYAPPYSIPTPYYGPGFIYSPPYTYPHLNGTPISYCFTHQP